jgi:muramoyltetrapeptide carboxypeptidase
VNRIKPPPLPSGGTVGIVAPASPFHNRSTILRGIEWWEERGYHVKLASGLFERSGYLAGDPASRARDLEAMFSDPGVDAIQCLQGGYGSTELLEQLDFDLLRAYPKPFVGKSDITALHTAFGAKAEIVTFYGPGLVNVNAADAPAENGKALLRALTATEALGAVPANPDDPYVRSLGGGQARGVMVGGALWPLSLTIRTPWEVDLQGKVFFFEEIDEAPWRMDALLTFLRQSGVLDGVVAVVIGELTNCDWREDRSDFPQTLSLEDVLEKHVEALGVPAIYGLPLGHGKNLITIPLGVEVEVDGDTRRLSIVEPALTPEPHAP